MQANTIHIKGLLIWGVCTLFFLYEFFLRTVLGSFQTSLSTDLALSSFQFSLLSTAFFLLIYGAMQIPVGFIIDRIGLKKSLLIASLSCAFACIAFSYTSHFTSAMICRVLMGFGASFGFIAVLIAINDWLPHKYLALFIGLSNFIGTMGPIVAAGPLELLIINHHISWRLMFFSLGIIGSIIAILAALFVKNNPQKSGKYLILRRPEKLTSYLSRLFQRSQPWFIALLATSLYFTTEYLSENEGRFFLSLKGIAASDAAFMLTVAWIGYAVGSPLVGLLSDLAERRKSILIYLSFTGLISIILILYSFNAMYLYGGFLLLGISASSQTICCAMIAEQFKKSFATLGFSLNNAFIITFSAINAPLIGWLLDQNTHTATPVDHYIKTFSILIVLTLIGACLAIFYIKETYCKSASEPTILQ